MATVPIRIIEHRRPPRSCRSGQRSAIPPIIAATGDNSPIMEKRPQGFSRSAAGSPPRQSASGQRTAATVPDGQRFSQTAATMPGRITGRADGQQSERQTTGAPDTGFYIREF